MARIQILELPTVYREHGEDETPFVLVIDQASDATVSSLGLSEEALTPRRTPVALTELVGARAILVFKETVDIPANEVTLTEATEGNVVRLRVEPDLTGFREQVMAEAAQARADARAFLK